MGDVVEDVFDCIPSKQKKFELMAPENESSPSDSKAEYGKLCNVNDQFPVRFGNCEDNTDFLHVAIVRNCCVRSRVGELMKNGFSTISMGETLSDFVGGNEDGKSC